MMFWVAVWPPVAPVKPTTAVFAPTSLEFDRPRSRERIGGGGRGCVHDGHGQRRPVVRHLYLHSIPSVQMDLATRGSGRNRRCRSVHA
jgi:hypothetical protein